MNDNRKVVGVRVPKAVRSKFTAKAKEQGKAGGTVVREFIYDFLGESIPADKRLKVKPKSVTIGFSDELYNKLDAICKQKGISKAALLRELMARYVKDNE